MISGLNVSVNVFSLHEHTMHVSSEIIIRLFRLVNLVQLDFFRFVINMILAESMTSNSLSSVNEGVSDLPLITTTSTAIIATGMYPAINDKTDAYVNTCLKVFDICIYT